MMTKFFPSIIVLATLLISIFSPNHVEAQDEKQDLLKKFKNKEINAELLNTLAMYYYESSTDSGFYFARMALEYAKAERDNVQIGEAYYQVGSGYAYTGHLDSALFFYDLSLDFYLKTKKSNDIAGVANDIGQLLLDQGKTGEAMPFFNLALSHIKKDELAEGYFSILINISVTYFNNGEYAKSNEQYFKILEEGRSYLPKEKIAVIYNNIGLNYRRTSNYYKSTIYYEKAMRIDDSLGLKQQYSVDIINMGNTFYLWKKLDQANKYFFMALKIFDDLKLEAKKAAVLADIAGVYRAMEKFDSSLFFLDRSLENAKAFNNKVIEANCYLGYGMTFFTIGKLDDALEKSSKALAIFSELKQKHSLANTYMLRGRIFLSKNNTGKALASLLIADSLGKLTKNLDIQKDAALEIANTFSRKGDYKTSDHWYKQYISLNDSIFNLKSHELVAEMEVKLDLLSKEREVEKIRMENELKSHRLNQQNKIVIILIISLLTFLVLGIYIYALYKAKAKSYKRLFEKNIEKLGTIGQNDGGIQSIMKTAMPDSKMAEMYEILEKKMVYEKLFLDQELNAHKLAELINTNTTYLSQIVNERFGDNFNSFVNKYRIDHAQKMLLDPNFAKLTIEAVAMECGFSSKSAFNQAFKKFTGLTPSYYQKQTNL